MSARRIVIIGAGPAGVGAALAARQQDAAADVLLVSDEPCEPYEKPPLSKAVLTGKAKPEDAPIAGPRGVAGQGIALKLGTRCTAIDRAAHNVTTQAGEHIPYDALVLATGSLNRTLPLFPVGQPRIHYLRSHDEALALRQELGGARTLLVVGAGLIGLEVAASAREIGIAVTVIEIAPRILARVCDEETSALIQSHHTRHDVDIRLGTAIAAVRSSPDGIAVETKAGETITADLAVVGAGVGPDDRLAKSAGLAVQDGIIIDERCATSDPSILAAGDCTRFPGPHGPVRLENWRHAQEQGAVAGRNAAGGEAAYNVAPSFWSEQYDLYIQGAGWPPPPHGGTNVRREIGPNALLRFELDGNRVAYVFGINAQRDIAAARRLIERRVPVDPTELADPSRPLAAMLKAKA